MTKLRWIGEAKFTKVIEANLIDWYPFKCILQRSQFCARFSNHAFLYHFRISHTTRKPHKEETAGKDYHFVTEEKFEMDIKMVMHAFVNFTPW
jgi:hypothetical protein